MLSYFEPNSFNRFRGRPRCTIVTTLNKDIKNTLNTKHNFPITQIKSRENLQYVCQLAYDRKLWKDIIENICGVAEAEKTH